MSHTLAYSAPFRGIYVFWSQDMPLALENRGFELPQVMEQVVALGVIRIYQKFMGSHLLVISTNRIGFVFARTREFLVIMVRVLFR